MSLRIRLSRMGAKKRPTYRIVVADARAPRDGRFIERLGHYNPLLPREHAERVVVDADKTKAWLAKGAQPTERVLRFLDAAGVMTRPARDNPNKGKPGKKAVERAEARRQAEEDARAAAEQAAAEPVAEAPADEPADASEAPAEAEAIAEAETPADEAAAEGEEAEKPAG